MEGLLSTGPTSSSFFLCSTVYLEQKTLHHLQGVVNTLMALGNGKVGWMEGEGGSQHREDFATHSAQEMFLYPVIIFNRPGVAGAVL